MTTTTEDKPWGDERSNIRAGTDKLTQGPRETAANQYRYTSIHDIVKLDVLRGRRVATRSPRSGPVTNALSEMTADRLVVSAGPTDPRITWEVESLVQVMISDQC